MDEPSVCAICGNPIEVGQAWMEADGNDGRQRAHVECVYRDAPSGRDLRQWAPGGPGSVKGA
jgi:hypothetical protein